MKNEKILEIVKNGHLVVPLYLLKHYKKLKLTLEEFLLLMYFYNQGRTPLFNPNQISEDLDMNVADVMMMIDSLTKKHFLFVEALKNEKGLMEEVVQLDDFYQKILSLVTDDVVTSDSLNSDIFEVVEKEFGRTLSPMESEIIRAWLDSGMREELITEAIREATLNGVGNLRYIEKILYEWEKQGIKTKEDVMKYKLKRHKEKEKEQVPEIFEYEWFDDDEE